MTRRDEETPDNKEEEETMMNATKLDSVAEDVSWPPRDVDNTDSSPEKSSLFKLVTPPEFSDQNFL